ncbi:MAG: hypothetical protein ABSF81_02570 [Bacteroidales bacterium]|jgi:hypothetical protein
MNGDRLMQQVTAIFSVFMVLFYLGAGIYFVFYFNLSNLNKPVRVLLGSAFIFYGLYRAFRTYVKIVEVFFTKDEDDE